MKRLFIIIVIFLNIVSIKLYGQWVIIWTQSHQGTAQDIAIDNNGYVYVTGYSYNGANNDYFTIKYDSSGNTILTQRYDGGIDDYAEGIAVDNNGYVYVTGYSFNGSDNDYFTIKYAVSGGTICTIWTQRYNSGDNDYAFGIAIDNNGYVYVTGYSFNGSDNDYFTIKYSNKGNTIWTQRYDSGSYDNAYDIAIDNNGYVYVTGFSYNGSDFDYFTIKYDLSGSNIIWTQKYDSGTGDDDARGIAIDNNGYVYVTGYSYNGSDYDYCTVKYDSSGSNIIWTQKYDSGTGDDEPYGIAVDNNGYVYVTGSSYNGSDNDYVVIKYDSDGNTIWTQRYDSGASDDKSYVAVDNNGYVYVTGDLYFTIKYEQPPYPAAPSGLSAADNNSYIKISWTDNTINERGFKIYRSYDGISYEVIGKVPTGITTYNDTGYDESKTNWYKVSATNFAGEITSSSIKWAKEIANIGNEYREYGINEIVLVPNPYHYGKEEDKGKITFYKVSTGVSIEIYSINGRKIKELRYDIEGNNNKIEWDVTDEKGRELPTGIYISKVTDNSGNKKYITFFIKR